MLLKLINYIDEYVFEKDFEKLSYAQFNISYNTFLFYFIFTLLVYCVAYILSKKSIKMNDKLITYECGFKNFNNISYKNSLNIVLLICVFIIFEIELVVLAVVLYSLLIGFSYFKFIFSIVIIFFLFIGFFYEYFYGVFDFFIW